MAVGSVGSGLLGCGFRPERRKCAARGGG